MTTLELDAAVVDQAKRAVVDAAVVEAQHQAGELARLASEAGALPVGVAGNEERINLYLQARAGLDVGREIALLRRQGATWAQIGAATGMARQSAHERWAKTVVAILDLYGTGELVALAGPGPS